MQKIEKMVSRLILVKMYDLLISEINLVQAGSGCFTVWVIKPFFYCC